MDELAAILENTASNLPCLLKAMRTDDDEHGKKMEILQSIVECMDKFPDLIGEVYSEYSKYAASESEREVLKDAQQRLYDMFEDLGPLIRMAELKIVALKLAALRRRAERG